MGFASLCCVPIIPLRGMRSSKVEIEVFDGWTRRQREGFNKALSETSPPTLFNSLKLNSGSSDHLPSPPKRMTFDDMINKAKAAQCKADVKHFLILPLDQNQEEYSVGAGDSPRCVDLRVSHSDTNLNHKTNTNLNTQVSQSDTNLTILKTHPKLNIPVSQSDTKFNLKTQPDLNVQDVKLDTVLENKEPSRSLGKTLRQCIQRLTSKRKGSQKDLDIEKVIQDSVKSCKEPEVKEAAKSCKKPEVKEAAKKPFGPYLMDLSFEEIRSYHRSDVVYTPYKVVRQFGEMLMDMGVEDIKRYCGGFVKVSTSGND